VALAAGLVWVAGCATAPPRTAAYPDPTLLGSPRLPEAAEANARRAALGLPVEGRNTEVISQPEAGQAETTFAELVRASEAADLTATLTGGLELIGLGRSGDPGALLTFGHIAEGRHDWETAMRLYQLLPADNPQRTASLLRIRLQWRLSNLQECARQSIASPRLTRSELAILLVSLAPQLEAAGGGSSPVMSDIIELPCYRRVLTAVRLGLLNFDHLEHRFFPSRAARPEEVRSAVAGLCHILDLKPPVWCGQAETTAGCTLLSVPVRGEQVAMMVSRLTEEEP